MHSHWESFSLNLNFRRLAVFKKLHFKINNFPLIQGCHFTSIVIQDKLSKSCLEFTWKKDNLQFPTRIHLKSDGRKFFGGSENFGEQCSAATKTLFLGGQNLFLRGPKFLGWSTFLRILCWSKKNNKRSSCQIGLIFSEFYVDLQKIKMQKIKNASRHKLFYLFPSFFVGFPTKKPPS